MKTSLALVIVGLTSALSGAAAPTRLSLTDVFQLETALDPQISPDGKRIVYTRSFADIMDDRMHSNLWIVNFDGSGNRPLTTGKFNDASPRWSPDGSQIAFTSNRDAGGAPQIWRMWLDSGQMAKVTSVQQAPAGIQWSPDGKWISFTMLVPEAPRKIATLPTPPEGAHWAEPAKVIDKLVYRFNGAGYLKPGYAHVFIVPGEGGTPRQISSGNFQHGGIAFRAGEPVWSPDGRSLLKISSGNFQHGGIAFRAGEPVWSPDGRSLLISANRNADWEREPLNSDIYEFQIGDGSVRALTKRFGPDGTPSISPDGKQIAYAGFDDKRQGYQVSKLYIMNRDGSGSRQVTISFDRDVQQPQWAPDGKGVYFLSDDQGNTGIHYTTLDGSVRKVAGFIGSTVSSYSGGGSLSIAKNGNFATVHAKPDVPGDIAAGTLSSPELRVLTAVNEDLFAGKELGKLEEIWYTSSRDNRKIQGWILKPPQFNPAKKYPLILEIHGGPFANYGDRFDIEKQLMAAKDYVVLYTNPRGSTSYGGDFGNLIHHAYPGDDFFDLNSGVDAVIAKGYIDPAKVFVTGGSGGGVLTCWMIGRSPRFKAAVTVYPVINWYSFVLTSDIGNWTAKNWFPGLPWDHVEHYEKRSLLSVVKNVKTPTMVLTGEEDYRTPMSDSEQYYQALQLLGVETVLVRVPGEPHGIRVRPSHHVSKIAHIIDWFEQHRN